MAIQVQALSGPSMKQVADQIAAKLTGESALITNYTIHPMGEVGGFGAFLCRVLVSVGAATQSVGSGLDDITAGGTYTGAKDCVITLKISTAAGTDKFQWKKDGGAYSAEISMTGAAQLLTEGVTATWLATTGHDLNDEWTIACMFTNSAP